MFEEAHLTPNLRTAPWRLRSAHCPILPCSKSVVFIRESIEFRPNVHVFLREDVEVAWWSLPRACGAVGGRFRVPCRWSILHALGAVGGHFRALSRCRQWSLPGALYAVGGRFRETTVPFDGHFRAPSVMLVVSSPRPRHLWWSFRALSAPSVMASGALCTVGGRFLTPSLWSIVGSARP